MKLSLLIPVYNESACLPALLDRLEKLRVPGLELEFVFVDDASSDDSFGIIENRFSPKPDVVMVRHPENRGKGAAVRTALSKAGGDIVVIQDADLEYDPDDLAHMVRPILEGRTDVVFGSRNLRSNPRYSPLYFAGNMFLNVCVGILYGKYVSDMETCYKMMKRDVFLGLGLCSDGFDIEPEITGKLLRQRRPIAEIPIQYRPRSRAEGKKITVWDGVRALGALIRWRFANIKMTTL